MMKCDGFTLVKPLRLTDRLALTSYEIRFNDDGLEQEVLGIVPVLWQFIKDGIDHATYDLGISLKMIADDHPRLRWCLRYISAWLMALEVR
jgi:hypothetical protein